MVNSYVENAEYSVLFEKVFDGVLKYLKLPDDFSVDISVVDEAEIKALNKENRKKDEVTDVLSFPNIVFSLPYKKTDYETDFDYETNKISLGDIIICEKRMKEQAIEYAHSEVRELAFLALHGLLHVFGFDHLDDCDKTKMRKAEEDILNSLNIIR